MNRQFFIFLLALFSWAATIAQTEEEKPLRQVLLVLEERYQIRFGFVDENIENIKVEMPSDILTLTEALFFLQTNTSLVYKQLNDRFVVVSKPTLNTVDICGRLLDINTKSPVSGVTILIGTDGVSSNEEGLFQIADVAMGEMVTIRLLGYKSFQFSAEELSVLPCKTIYLRPQEEQLQEVVVRGFITQGIDKKSDGSFLVNTDLLGILPGLVEPDVLQTIQALPGIQSIDETVSNINVRGGANDQNLVLWDGIRMYQSGHFFGLISAFNPYLAKEVTLIKNGTSAFYGDGVSSTIAIKSDDNITGNLSGGVGVNLINGDIYGSIPINEKTSIQISARRSIADMVQTPTYKQYFDRAFRDTDVLTAAGNNVVLNTDEEFSFYDFTGKLLYDISPNHRLRISLLNVVNKVDYVENAEVNGELESRTSGLVQQNQGVGLQYTFDVSQKMQFHFEGFASLYDLQAVNFDVLNEQRLQQENEVLDTGLKFDGRFQVNNILDVRAGYQFYEVGITNLEDVNNPVFRRRIKEVLRSHNAFVEAHYSSSEGRTNAILGIRSNFYQRFGKFIVEPRLSLSHRFTNDFSVQLLGEFKNQAVTQIVDFQNDFLGVENRRWVLADEVDVPIAESRQVSAGFNYQRNGFLISAEAYFKSVDGITTASQGFQNQFQSIRSAGSYDSYGMDFLINNRWSDFNAWVSYSYSKSTYDFPALAPPVFPSNLDITHTINVAASYDWNALKLSAGFNYRTGKPFTIPNPIEPIANDEINYDAPNALRLDDYMRTDISATYTFSFKNGMKLVTGASVWNILDQDNVVNTFYRVNDNNEIEEVVQTALGITPNASLRMFF
ncbi:TonB-dependent receptor plug domain-containing protein [Sungkyunkwania multivorans]|uniref:TonB-dependent receptor plug domain-containing protein n=1 Tax=Sungkyunkwania multivorans TaxID=1173618 RepID=A0ABW3CTG2_9FLAO